MTIKVTLEYNTLDEAIVALGLLAESTEARKSPARTTSPGEAEQVAKTAEKVLPKAPSKKVQALLRDYGLTEAQVAGTGKNGAITEKDVQRVVKEMQVAATELSSDVPVSEPETGDAEDSTEVQTLDTCRAALKALNDAKGMQACIDLLKNDFKVNRVSDLHESRYGAFVKACNNAL